MKRFPYIIIVVVIFSVAASCIKAEEQKVGKIIGNESSRLSDSDLEAAKNKALEGDAESAFRVYVHYALGKFDKVSSFVWLQIAANKGHNRAQNNLGCIYMEEGIFKNLRLSRFWLKEAEKNGSKYATGWLKKLEELESKLQ